ncbi:MAG: hypothetical protein AAGA88_02815 [Pseudomonadota bacterium]
MTASLSLLLAALPPVEPNHIERQGVRVKPYYGVRLSHVIEFS